MATQECKDCGNEVSTRAKQCPHCGAPAKKKTGCLGVIGLLFFVAIIISVIFASLNENPTAAPAQPTETTPSSTEPQTALPAAHPNQAKQQEEPKQPEATPKPKAEPKPTPPDWDARQEELKAHFLPRFIAPEVGSRIALQLKAGGTQEGTLKNLTEGEIQIERGAATLGFTRVQLSTASRVLCFASDYATYEAYMQTKQERDAYETQERNKKAEIAAKLKAEEDARLAASRNKRIESGFSSWDGSHIALARIIKKSMNDPKSYKHDKTVWWDQGNHLIVRTSFRGKNAFGGVVLNWVKAKCDLDGNVIELIEQGP